MAAYLRKYGGFIRDHNYQASFLRRSCTVRPIPSGKKVYFVLLQFILYEIVSYSSELYLSQKFSSYLIANDHLSNEKSVPSVFLILRSLHLLFCLPMGFLADKYFGRTKVLVYSWIFLFATQCVFTIHITLFETYLYHYLSNAAFIVVTVLIVSVHAAALAGIHVNLISYGVDQLVRAFADELSSYFHCYYWCRSGGVFFVSTVSTFLLAFVNAGYILLIATVSCTLAVVINLVGTGWFVKAEKVGNPLLLIYRVLRYSLTAQRPVERSAFSYDGRPEPSRIDLAKTTHHGCFEDEKVEDVKVFLRILGILSSLLGFFCVSFLLYSVYLKQAMHLQYPQVDLDHHLIIHSHSINNCHGNNTMQITYLRVSTEWLLAIPTLVIMILIPILDRIFYPTVCCQWVATMFNRITAGICFSMLSILCALALEIWRYKVSATEKGYMSSINTIHYFYNYDSSSSSDSTYYVASKISIFFIIPQFVFQGVAEAFALVTICEFIYAQSPDYMKGVLIGCLFTTEGIAMLLGSLLFPIMAKFDAEETNVFKTCHASSPCDCNNNSNGFAIALYSVVVVIALISFVTFRCVVHKFVPRKREKDLIYFSRHS